MTKVFGYLIFGFLNWQTSTMPGMSDRYYSSHYYPISTRKYGVPSWLNPHFTTTTLSFRVVKQ